MGCLMQESDFIFLYLMWFDLMSVKAVNFEEKDFRYVAKPFKRVVSFVRKWAVGWE